MEQFLADAGLTLQDRIVADIGCGDGMIDLGLLRRSGARELVGYDLNPVDVEHLRRVARSQGVSDELPPTLRFVESEPDHIPAADGQFDVVVSWSAFEHVSDLDAMSAELARILSPHGVAFVQVWPLYYSQHGSHLMDWFPDGFVHLTRSAAEIERTVRATAADRGWAEYMLGEYAVLNRARLDDIHRALCGAGLAVTRVELLSNVVALDPAVSRSYPLSDLAIAGFKLLAVHASAEQPALPGVRPTPPR